MEREERARRNRSKKNQLRRDPLLSFHGDPLLQEQYSLSTQEDGLTSGYDSSQHNVMRITVTNEEFEAGMVVGGMASDFGRRGVPVNRESPQTENR